MIYYFKKPGVEQGRKVSILFPYSVATSPLTINNRLVNGGISNVFLYLSFTI